MSTMMSTKGIATQERRCTEHKHEHELWRRHAMCPGAVYRLRMSNDPHAPPG